MPAKRASTLKNKKEVKKETGVRRTSPALRQEVWSIISIAFSILLLVSAVSPDSVGVLGRFINALLYGLFGMGAVIFPVIIILLNIYSIISKNSINQTYQKVSGITILVLFLSLVHLMGMDTATTYDSFFNYLESNFIRGGALNGGLVGALFGNFLYTLLGRIGSFIAVTAVMLALLVYLSGRSFFGGVRSAYRGVKDSIDEMVEDYEPEDDENWPEEPLPQTPKNSKKSKYKQAVDFVVAGGRRPQKSGKIRLFQEEYEKAGRKPGSALEIEFNPELLEGDLRELSHLEQEPQNDSSAEYVEDEFRINITGIVEEQEPETVSVLAVDGDSGESRSISFLGDIDDGDDTDGNTYENIDSLITHEPQSGFETVNTFSDNRRYTKKEQKEMEREAIVAQIAKEATSASDKPKVHEFPPETLLKKGTGENKLASKAQILETSKKLEATLKSFGVEAKVVEVSKGPTVTRYELSPGQGVKVSKISGLADDLALNLAAQGIRIEAPIPGKAAVGIEVPNKEAQIVYFRDIVSDEEFKKFPSNLAFGLGKDIGGKTVVYDIGKMPHLLIAGATGAGKSVCINTLVGSILYKASPDMVKLIMIDPKVVELSVYNGIPHLLIPVVTDPKKASGALNWAVREMLRRYDLFAQTGVRDLKGYNQLAEQKGEREREPQIVIIIDELADLMMAAPGEVEDSICRLAQMARAAGLHLIIATQRPSVDVITGVIKANIPSRLAFSVSSGTDSRTILDMVGAEKLLGRGDMLFSPIGTSKPIRIQGAFISDKEVEAMVDFLKVENEYSQEMIDNITSSSKEIEISEDTDEFFEPAVEFVIAKEKASASMLQRQFRIGYNRAARLIEDLEAKGIIGPEDGSKPRKVLMTGYMWQDIKSGQTQGNQLEPGELPLGIQDIQIAEE